MRGRVYRQLLGEFVATFAFLYTAMATVAGQLAIQGSPYLACILASLLMVVAIVPAFHSTGLPHANPCLTLVALVAGVMPAWMFPLYLGVQSLGALLALVCTALTVPPYSFPRTLGALVVKPPIPLAPLFLGEYLAVFIFMLVVISVGLYSPRFPVEEKTENEVISRPDPLVMNAHAMSQIHQMSWCIGAALALVITAGWTTSGAVINPWRCLIPTLVTWQGWPQTGLYLLAQLTATLTAFFLCKFLQQ